MSIQSENVGKHVLFDPTVEWFIDGVSSEVNGTQIEFQWDEDVTDFQKIGARSTRIVTLYKDTQRIVGLCAIKITFPRISREFFQTLRRYREFGGTFNIEMSLLDPTNPVLCCRYGNLYNRFWAPHRLLKNNSPLSVYTKVYTRPNYITPWTEMSITSWNSGNVAAAREGYVDLVAIPMSSTQVGMTYTWSPLVKVFEITPNDIPGLAESVYKPQVVLREIE